MSSSKRDHLLKNQCRLDLPLVEVLAGLRQGSPEERRRLDGIQKKTGSAVYAQGISVLAGAIAGANGDARRLFEQIVEHRNALESSLRRAVSLQTAAFDYLAVRGIATGVFEEKEGLPGHDSFTENLKREAERVRRYGSCFALLLIDINDLGGINETGGRDAGDSAIRRLNELLSMRIRAADTVYRRENGRFAILVPNADREMSSRVAEKLLADVGELKINYPADPSRSFTITVSIGAASFDHHTVQSPEGILKTTAMVLAEAKKAGKGRITTLAQSGNEKDLVEMAEKVTEMKPGQRRFVIKGLPISQGVAFGKAYIHCDILAEDIKQYAIEEHEFEKELSRARDAMDHVRRDIELMERQVRSYVGQEYADIFTVHKAMLGDSTVIEEIESRLRAERLPAEHAIKNVFKKFENQLVASENELMRERHLDVADLSRRLLRHMAGLDRNIFGKLPKNRIIVAKRLLPSESVHLSRGSARGIITEKGSRNSHAAILARGLGIPYVSETDLPVERIQDGDYLIVNADHGEIIVNPSRQEREEMRLSLAGEEEHRSEMIRKYSGIHLEKNGLPVRVLANVATKRNVIEAIGYGADGIGLLRLEQIYMQNRTFPTQEQLLRTLGDMFDAAGDREVTVRLLDIGGDKELPYLNLREGDDTMLGMRGVRLLLKYPRLLDTQLAVLLKLSARYNVKILVPMVTLPDEMAAIREQLALVASALDEAGVPCNRRIRLGSMIEVPAAVLQIDDILKCSDFVSIGTNDLIQYLMASDRECANLARYYEAGAEIVLSYIRHVVEHARARNIECDLCGELAADTASTEKLLGLGLENFSVSSSGILNLKSKLAELLMTPAMAISNVGKAG